MESGSRKMWGEGDVADLSGWKASRGAGRGALWCTFRFYKSGTSRDSKCDMLYLKGVREESTHRRCSECTGM
jgi:hypothetical protein